MQISVLGRGQNSTINKNKLLVSLVQLIMFDLKKFEMNDNHAPSFEALKS